MAETLRCDIVTPTQQIFSDEVTFVSIPATDGEMGVMDMHAPTITTLGNGEIRVRKGEGEGQLLRFAASGGYAEIEGSKVIVMANRALSIDDIDQDQLDGFIQEFTQRLQEYPEGDSRRVYVEEELAWNKLIKHLVEE